MTLRAEDLHFGYRPRAPVVRNVSFGLAQRAVTALVGPNGAGKSTLLRLLLGTLTPQAGRVTLDGRPLAALGHRERAARIGYVPQRASLAFAFTVRQVVRLGLYAAGRADGGAVDGALRAVDLAPRADEPFGVLSAGQQQRATLARVLAQLHGRPSPIILADEPVSAMDPRHALETMTLLRGIAAAGGSVLVVLHDLTLALRWADRALVLDAEGRLVADGPAAESLEPSVLGGVFGVRFDRIGDRALIPSLPPGGP